MFAVMQNRRLNQHIIYTLLDDVSDGRKPILLRRWYAS